MTASTENPTGIRYAIVDLNGRSHSYHGSLDEVRAALLAAYDGDDLDDFYVVGYSGEGKAVYGPEPARSLLLAKRTIHRTVAPERGEAVCTCGCDEGYVDAQGVERCAKCKLPDAVPVVPERGQDEAGVKDGGNDDATHLRIGDSPTTLCGLDVESRNCDPLGAMVPGWGAGCWTCLQRAKEAYDAIAPAAAGVARVVPARPLDPREWIISRTKGDVPNAVCTGPLVEMERVIPKARLEQAEKERDEALAARPLDDTERKEQR